MAATEEQSPPSENEAAPIAVLRVEEDGSWEIVEPELPIEMQQRVRVIQRLLAVEGTKSYEKAQKRLAKELGMSVRSLQRMVKRWRESGLAGLKKQVRSDQGAAKISAQWQEFVIKTYREGNRGSRSISSSASVGARASASLRAGR